MLWKATGHVLESLELVRYVPNQTLETYPRSESSKTKRESRPSRWGRRPFPSFRQLHARHRPRHAGAVSCCTGFVEKTAFFSLSLSLSQKEYSTKPCPKRAGSSRYRTISSSCTSSRTTVCAPRTRTPTRHNRLWRPPRSPKIPTLFRKFRRDKRPPRPRASACGPRSARRRRRRPPYTPRARSNAAHLRRRRRRRRSPTLRLRGRQTRSPSIALRLSKRRRDPPTTPPTKHTPTTPTTHTPTTTVRKRNTRARRRRSSRRVPTSTRAPTATNREGNTRARRRRSSRRLTAPNRRHSRCKSRRTKSRRRTKLRRHFRRAHEQCSFELLLPVCPSLPKDPPLDLS